MIFGRGRVSLILWAGFSLGAGYYDGSVWVNLGPVQLEIEL